MIETNFWPIEAFIDNEHFIIMRFNKIEWCIISISLMRFAQKGYSLLLKTSKWQLFSKSALIWMFKLDLRIAFLSKWQKKVLKTAQKLDKSVPLQKLHDCMLSNFTLIYGFYEVSFFLLFLEINYWTTMIKNVFWLNSCLYCLG